MELLANMTLGAKGHEVKVCSWAADVDGNKTAWEADREATKVKGETKISDLPSSPFYR